jgi:hypothetical protein
VIPIPRSISNDQEMTTTGLQSVTTSIKACLTPKYKSGWLTFQCVSRCAVSVLQPDTHPATNITITLYTRYVFRHNQFMFGHLGKFTDTQRIFRKVNGRSLVPVCGTAILLQCDRLFKLIVVKFMASGYLQCRRK